MDWAHNNAGLSTSIEPVTSQRRDRWDFTIGVTLTGTMLCLKHEIAQMQVHGAGGAIVNTGSVDSLIGHVNQSPYVAAKWGVIGLAKTAALEVASDNIRVNVIGSGLTKTTQVLGFFKLDPQGAAAMEASIPMRRVARPDEQPRAAVWLCSDKASFITGAVLTVDGGMTGGIMSE